MQTNIRKHDKHLNCYAFLLYIISVLSFVIFPIFQISILPFSSCSSFSLARALLIAAWVLLEVYTIYPLRYAHVAGSIYAQFKNFMLEI